MELTPYTGVHFERNFVMGRRKYDEKFRADAVELARVSGRPRGQLAADLGVSDPTLARWMAIEKENDGPLPLDVSERAELERLRVEKREWVMEREILKKATAFWVKELNE